MSDESATGEFREFVLGASARGAREWLQAQKAAAKPPEPSPAAFAATVLLLKDDPFEVFLFERASTMAFAPSVWVFPGGRVDAGDAHVSDAAIRWPDDGPAEFATRFDLPVEKARCLAVAAIREVFEEVGVLLAGDALLVALAPFQSALENHAVSFAGLVDEVVAEQVSGDRAPSRSGSAGEQAPSPEETRPGEPRKVEPVKGGAAEHTSEMNSDPRLAADALVPVDRWITPVFEPRRYDTFFFAAALPSKFSGESVEARTSEAALGRWWAPDELLEAAQAGSVKLMPPTRINLERLRGFRSAGEALENLRGSRRHIAAICPTLHEVDDAAGKMVLRIPAD